MNEFVFFMCSCSIRVKWVSCYHDMVRPQAEDGAGGLQIWITSVRVPNEQSLTADEGSSSCLRLVRGVNDSMLKQNVANSHIYLGPGLL